MTQILADNDQPVVVDQQPALVLMLTDDFVLENVARLSTRKPEQFSVHFRSGNGKVRNFIATECQMVRLRDQFDRAIDQARALR